METFKINYKSDFVLRLASDAGWGTAFTLEFWSNGAPTKRYYATHDGNGNYTNCKPDSDTELRVMFDDHGLGIGNLMLRITYSLADKEFRTGEDDEVINVTAITVLNDEGEEVNVMLNLEGETAAEVQYSLPLLEAEKKRQNAEAQRNIDETQRIAAEQQRKTEETLRNQAELDRQASEDVRKSNESTREAAEQQRQAAETARATEFEANEDARNETFETNEAERQATFEANEAERQVLYEKVAKNTEDIELLNANTGVSEYPEFSEAKAYAVGEVVLYEGLIYRFTSEHAAGAWNASQVESWSERKEVDEKVAELETQVNNSLKDMSESNFSFFIDGNNDEIVRHKLAGLKQGRKYRLIIKNNNYTSDSTPQNVYIFQIYKYTGSVGTIVDGVAKGNTVNNYYDFEIDNSDYFGCFIRADIGQRVYMYVVDITEPCNAVWFGGSTLPNIDTATHTITFPSDGAFMVNNKLSLPINSGTPIDYYISSSSSTVLVYNIITRTISARAFSEQAIDGDVVFGGIKTLYGKPEQFLNATLPFDFTINGKLTRDIAIDAKNRLTNGLFGFSFTGKGMNGDESGIIRYNFNTIKKGRKYRIVIVNNDYATSEITAGYGIFQIYKYTGTIGTIVTNVAKGQSVNNYYDFVADDLTADYYGVFVRANSGVVVMMYMMDITELENVEQDKQKLYFENKGESNYYMGADISLKHSIQISSHPLSGGTINYSQGMAYYNNYFVICGHNLSAIYIYNSTTYERVAAITPELGLTVHCNTVSFGRKYDDNDLLPLLYCSSEAESERRIFVLRISNDLSAVTLVQTIVFPSINEMPIYWPNGAVDIEGNRLVVIGYNTNAHSAVGANVYPQDKIGVFTFDLPQVLTLTALSVNDIKDSFWIPAITTTQGFQVKNNRIYQIYGLPSQVDPDIRLGVIDLTSKRVLNLINLKGYGITTEPEGLAIKDDSIFVDFFGTLREFQF